MEDSIRDIVEADQEMPVNRRAAASSRYRLWLCLVIIGALAFGFVQGASFENARAGGGFADSYWTQFWLTSYQDGYLRRSLLGSIVAALVPAGTSVTVLSAVHLAISSVLLAAGIGLVATATKRSSSARASLACAALFGFSPVGPFGFETTGDPLQAATLLWIAAAILARNLREPMRVMALGVVAVVAILIHEAAAFFVLPYLLLTAPGVRSLAMKRRLPLMMIVVALVAVAIGLLASDSAGVPRFYLANAVDQSRIMAARAATPGFGQVIRSEYLMSLSSADALGHTFARLLRFSLVPMAIVLFMALYENRHVRLAPLFLLWVLCGLPLYAIAHDWGRFGVLTFYFVLAAAVLDSRRLHLDALGTSVERAWRTVRGRLVTSGREATFARMVLAVIVLSSSLVWTDYRIAGGRPSLILAAPALALAALLYHRRTPARAEQVSDARG